MSPPNARRGPGSGPRSDQAAAKRTDRHEDTAGTPTPAGWHSAQEAAEQIVADYGIPFARELAAAIRTLPGVKW